MGNQRKKRTQQEIQHRRRQRTQVIVGALVLLVIAAAAYIFLSKDDDAPVTGGSNAADEFAGGPPVLAYADFADGKDLRNLDIENEEDTVVAELSRPGNTRAAPGSRWLSIQMFEDLSAKKAQPVLYLFDPESEEETRLGVGFDPLWSADGSLLAWHQPEDESLCGEEDCRGDLSVVVTDPETGETTPWTDPGPYEVRAWAGDHLIIADSPPGGVPVLQSVSPEGEMQQLDIRPIDFWGASPDGRWVVQSGDEVEARFLTMEDGQITGEGELIGIREGTKLGQGAWAHDSSHVAAFAVGEGTSLDLVTFSPDEPEPVARTEGGESSTGAVMWAPDNDGVVFQRFTGDALEAVHCPLDGDCTTVLSWTTGVSLLRVE